MKRYGILLLGIAAGFLGFASWRSPAQTDAEPHGRTIHPHALGFNTATQRLYAVDQDADRVLVLDKTGTQSSIPVGKQPNAIAIDPDIDRIYVVNAGSGSVSVIDGRSDRVVATAPTDTRPYAIGIDTSLHRAYVTNTFSNKVTVIDDATNEAQQLPVGASQGTGFVIFPCLPDLEIASQMVRVEGFIEKQTGETHRCPFEFDIVWRRINKVESC